MTEYTIDAIWHQGKDDETETKVTFLYHREDEGEPAYFELVKVVAPGLLQGDAFDDLREKALKEWAQDWLDDAGWEACMELVQRG